MSATVIIGAGKFALEVVRYLEDAVRHGVQSAEVRAYLAVAGEETAAPSALVKPFTMDALREADALVLASADPDQRKAIVGALDESLRTRFITVIHPSSTIPPEAISGPGVVIGPHCHIGVNAHLGGFCALNYLLSIGHHAQIGEGNFFSPGFHCGNSVTIGANNFFGLSCTVGPGLTIGQDNRFQAGSLILENIGNGTLCVPTQRFRLLPREGISQ